MIDLNANKKIKDEIQPLSEKSIDNKDIKKAIIENIIAVKKLDKQIQEEEEKIKQITGIDYPKAVKEYFPLKDKKEAFENGQSILEYRSNKLLKKVASHRERVCK